MKKFFKFIFVLIILGVVFALLFNVFVWYTVKDRVRTVDESLSDTGYECIIVLGCGVWGDEPTPLLSDRLDAAVSLYKAGVAPKILMSGDHGENGYDEVSVMRNYAIEHGVPSEDIFMDHAGFSTYETMCRASDIFGIGHAVVVTQKYHLFRSLYDARSFGIDAYGTVAEGHTFATQNLLMWEGREVLARVKDVIWCIVKPEPTFRGDKIDITGNGEVTLG